MTVNEKYCKFQKYSFNLDRSITIKLILVVVPFIKKLSKGVDGAKIATNINFDL